VKKDSVDIMKRGEFIGQPPTIVEPAAGHEATGFCMHGGGTWIIIGSLIQKHDNEYKLMMELILVCSFSSGTTLFSSQLLCCVRV
jgi:hypothetical protein